MDIFTFLLTKITEFQSYEFLGLSLWRLVSAIIILLGLIVLRGSFSAAFIALLQKLDTKTSTVDEEVVVGLRKSFRLVYSILTVLLTLYVFGINELLDWEGIEILGIKLWRLIAAALVVMVILSLRNSIRKFIFNLFRLLAANTKTTVDDQLIEALTPCFRKFYYIIALWVGFLCLGLSNDPTSKTDMVDIINLIVRSALIIVVAWAVYRGLDVVIYLFRQITARTETDLDDYLAMFVGKTFKVLVIAFGILMILAEWGYDVRSIIAGLGIGGLAVALGGKDFVANIFGFFTIFLDRSFSVGDWILTPDLEGTVEDVGIRSTKVRTFAQALVTIPNSVLANKPITNWSKMGKRRITFTLGVTYSSSSGQIQDLTKRIKEMLAEHPDIHPQTIFVYFSDFGPSSLDIFLYFFTNTTVWQEFLEVQHDVKLKMMEIVEDLGMSVAFPSQSIYMEDIEEKALSIIDKVKS